MAIHSMFTCMNSLSIFRSFDADSKAAIGPLVSGIAGVTAFVLSMIPIVVEGSKVSLNSDRDEYEDHASHEYRTNWESPISSTIRATFFLVEFSFILSSNASITGAASLRPAPKARS